MPSENRNPQPGRPRRELRRTSRPRQATRSATVALTAKEAARARAGPKKNFRQLVPQVRSVPRETILAEWKPLDERAIAATSAILNNAERPVLARFGSNNTRQDFARTILTTVCRRLHSKLVKGMPFPPPNNPGRSATGGSKSSHDEDLDIEKIQQSILSLENQLDPVHHSVALLKRELEIEEKETREGLCDPLDARDQCQIRGTLLPREAQNAPTLWPPSLRGTRPREA